MSEDDQGQGNSIVDYLNKAIHLKNAMRYSECADVLQELLTAYPTCAHAHYELSLAQRYQGRQTLSLAHAKQALAFDSRQHLFRIHYANQLAACGKSDEAIIVLDDCSPQNWDQMNEIRACVQFCRFMETYPRRLGHQALTNLAGRGKYLSEIAVESLLWDAIERRKPCALIRLGDGEGAWTFLSNSDEAKYQDLYRASRLSFLSDWFGTTELIEDDAFLSFSRGVSNAVRDVDIVGITDIARVDHEYRLVSARGICSSMNVLRDTGVLGESYDDDRVFCSNNVHHGLNAIGFFKRLLERKARILLISSHPGLAGKLASQGADIVASFTTPGDSRNFWFETGSTTPMRQFPDVFNRIAADLRGMDLSGVVALVAAGFVGKQYLTIIRRQGGVAIDLGGVADIWNKVG